MGYHVASNSLESLFSGVEYNTKTAAELRTAMNNKTAELKENIQVREGRIADLCKQYQISSKRLANLMMEFKNTDNGGMVSFESQTRADGETLVPAGVIANIVQERKMVDSERAQTTKLELVLRNLRETEQFAVSGTGEVKTRPCVHQLDDEELAYLGF